MCARYGRELSVDCGERWWTRAPEVSTMAATEEDGPDGSSMAELASAPNVNVTVPLQFFVKVRRWVGIVEPVVEPADNL